VDAPAAAVDFYTRAFGARVLHRVGEGDDNIVCQLTVDGARFWVTAADSERSRLSPAAAGGTTGRTLLVVDDPAALVERVATGADLTSPVSEEHGWLLGRIVVDLEVPGPASHLVLGGVGGDERRQLRGCPLQGDGLGEPGGMGV
jgi:PhnB protein